jgi:hypothetical protein
MPYGRQISTYRPSSLRKTPTSAPKFLAVQAESKPMSNVVIAQLAISVQLHSASSSSRREKTSPMSGSSTILRQRNLCAQQISGVA